MAKKSDVDTTKSDSAEVDITLAEFLESHPPGSEATVREMAGKQKFVSGGRDYYEFLTTDVQLHCPSPKCGGTRSFRLLGDSGSKVWIDDWNNRYLTYGCRNCEESRRVFAIRTRASGGGKGQVYKIGEFPPFGPPLPARVISLVGPDREMFLQGRRAENQGLGIGAFAYYRRVVENQWKRVVAEIIRVAVQVRAPEAMVENLKKAAEETQFRRAVDLIKEGVPESLKIHGQNPLTLLHAPLSEGIHDEPDEHCLVLATSIRVVLTELAERIGLALKDEEELTEAVTRLLNRKNARPKGGAT
jgi:hypothetical protein